MPIFLGVLAMVLGGSTYVVQKLVLDVWPPALLTVARLIIALPPLLMLVLYDSKAVPFRLSRGEGLRIVAVGVFGLAMPHLIGNYALRDTQALNGALLIGVEPITIVVLSALFLGERLKTLRILGLLTAFLGASLVAFDGDFARLSQLDGSVIANFLLILHGALWALYSVIGKPVLDRVSAVIFTALTSLVALISLAPFALMETCALDLDPLMVPEKLAGIIYLGFGVSFLGTVFWNAALSKLAASQMAALVFLQPVVGMLLGLGMGERVGFSAWVGGALVMFGVWMTERRRSTR